MTETLGAVVPMLMSAIGGLGIFMLGMKYMSEGMQAVAGDSLRRMISLVTDNRLMAAATGTGVTVLVQSSTITTVIVVGLANAGLTQLHQAVGIIMGANIGTTITGWILVLKIGAYGLPILGLGALVYLFTRRDRPKFIAMAVMGLGMIFFGLELMKDGFGPMTEIPVFVEAFGWFEASSYMGMWRAVLVGCLLTFLVQSSSATLGITIGLASTGGISFITAAALILGENIGTTITVILASIGANVNAKRTAYAHVLFNVFGVFWITLIFRWYVGLVARTVETVHGADPLTMSIGQFADPLEFAAVMTAAIALTHTGFNVTNTLVFLPFVKPYTRLLERLVPDPERKEVRQLKHLDARGVSAPVLGIEQSRAEVVKMGEGTLKMVDWIRGIAFDGPVDQRLVEKTFHREDILDNEQAEVVAFLTELLDDTVPHSVTKEGQRQLRIAHEYESVSDRLASILRGYLELQEKRLEIPAEQKQGLIELHDAVADFLRRATDAYARRGGMAESDAQEASGRITAMVRRLQDEQLRLMTESPVDPTLSMTITAILTDYRRVRAHTLNAHEATVDARPVAATPE